MASEDYPAPPAPMPPPPISVLLPYRDASATLDECLDSIQNQSFMDFELLAMDDHSSDRSAEMVRARASGDPRIRPLNAPRPGLVAALNHGLDQARGELVARMDADDLMYPQRLALQLYHLRRHPETVLLGTRVESFSALPIRAGMEEYLRWQNHCVTPRQIADDIYLESPFAHPSVMFRRRILMEAGGYRDGPFPEDYELWLRLHGLGHHMAKLPQVLLSWRDRPDRTSRVDPRYSRSAFDQLRARFLARDPRLHAGRELAIWGAGRKTRRRAELLLGHGFRPSVWVDIDPRKIGNRIDGVPVVAPQWLECKPRPLVLCYVARHGARELIDERLDGMGYRKGRDYLHVG